MNPVDGEKTQPFLYSIVCHDFNTKCIVPVFEFITTEHTEDSVGSYLYMAKKLLQRHINSNASFKWGSVIVMDFSWPLINAVLDNFLVSTFTQYLLWCFDVLVKKIEKLNNFYSSIIYLCSTHVLKIIIRKTNSIIDGMKWKNKKDHGLTSLLKQIKIMFIIFFGILQNTSTIESFENILMCLVFIFESKFVDENVIKSLSSMNKYIQDRDLITKIISDSQEETVNKSKEREHCLFRMEDEMHNYKKESPFSAHFQSKLNDFRKLINIETTGRHNKFYCPELMKVIEDFLYITPLWSSMIINHWNNNNDQHLPTRLTNNSVENYFGRLKNHHLNGIVEPSVLSSTIYDRALMKYLEFYCSDHTNSSKSKTTETVQCRRKPYKRKNKAFYYQKYN